MPNRPPAAVPTTPISPSPFTPNENRSPSFDFSSLIDAPFAIRADALIGTKKPIPEIVDHGKIAVGAPVVDKMELLLSPEPGKLSKPRSRNVVLFINIDMRVEHRHAHRTISLSG
jgi:hypothetical protein